MLSYIDLAPNQVSFVKTEIDSHLMMVGPLSSGKTATMLFRAIMSARDGKKCLIILSTNLMLKYVEQGLREIGMYTLTCTTYYNAVKYHRQYHYDVIFIDDAHEYSIEQLQFFSSISSYLVLAGDYSKMRLYTNSDLKASMHDILAKFSPKIFELYPFYITSPYHHLVTRFSKKEDNTNYQIPALIKLLTIEQQCSAVKHLISSYNLENTAILCFTKKLVNTVYSYFTNDGFPIEVYLTDSDNRINTIDFKSSRAKLMTIAASKGLHFDTVFVIGFDDEILYKYDEEAVEIVLTRSKEKLYLLYSDNLPVQLSFLQNNVSSKAIYDLL